MSAKQPNVIPNVPDTSGKEAEDCTSDSGFISGSNLIYSGEIPDETTPEYIELPAGIVEERSEHMRVDSGIYLSLSRDISDLSLKSDSNDLNNPVQTPVATAATKKDSPDEAPWKIHYVQNEDGDTYLHTVIVEGFAKVALSLIQSAPHPRLLDTPNDDAQTPLHLAVETSQRHVVRWLIAAGARPSPRDVRGDSPLHVAARRGDLDCVKAIVNPVQPEEAAAFGLIRPRRPYEKCQMDQWNYLGQTCVHVAAMQGHIDVLRHLVWFGANINAREGLEGFTALHYAVQRQDEAMVSFLLNECNTLQPELTTYGGRNALQLKLMMPAAIQQLLKKKGLASPYSSDSDEDSSSEGEDEMDYSSNMHRFVPNLVNASA